MSTTPGDGTPEEQDAGRETGEAGAEGSGAEIGVTEGEGSTFEPEEDPEAHD